MINLELQRIDAQNININIYIYIYQALNFPRVKKKSFMLYSVFYNIKRSESKLCFALKVKTTMGRGFNY